MKVIRWAVLNGAMLAMLWVGLGMDMAGPRNVGLFAVWYAAVISLFTCSENLRKKAADKPDFPLTPGWVDVSFDVFIIGILAWYGRWFSGVAYAFQMILCAALRERVKEIRSEASARPHAEARRGDSVKADVRCADCGRIVPRLEATEQTTFNVTHVRCEQCGDAAYERLLQHHWKRTPNTSSTGPEARQ